MPEVTITARLPSTRQLSPAQIEEIINVSYLTGLVPPGVVALPAANYRPPTPAERAQQPHILAIPKDTAAQTAEAQAIQEDMRGRLPPTGPTLQL